MPRKMDVRPIPSKTAREIAERMHYLHRKPNTSFAYGLFCGQEIVGIVTFGTPPSRHLMISACQSNPDCVIELNRLWVSDAMPRNTESWFVRRALSLLPARIVVSYADTAHGHIGVVYRAMGFNYAGWTDMDRKTPRFDYISPGKHSRDAFRGGYTERVRRRPKVKYWCVTGNKRERRGLVRICTWPSINWKVSPPPSFKDQEYAA